MNIKNWLRLFITTLGVGALASLIVGIGMQFTDPELKVWDPYLLLFHVFTGVLYSVLSQLGFFAYMTLNYIALDMIRRRIIWVYIQWFFILLTFGYLIILRHDAFATEEGYMQYTILPIILLITSIFIALLKQQLTNKTAFVPTSFFMFVVTALESIPALRENDALATMTMVIPLFACNAWQIVNLHKYVQNTKSPQ